MVKCKQTKETPREGLRSGQGGEVGVVHLSWLWINEYLLAKLDKSISLCILR